MKLVQILGPGCPQCTEMAQLARAAVEELGIDATVEEITDIDQIIEFGVLMTPALAVDGEVRAVGKVPSAEELKEMISYEEN